ncbi:unnamed protein product [Choristocarpus tenellus]
MQDEDGGAGGKGDGWDSSSNDGEWGGGMRDFERNASIKTRDALLENGDLLCRAESIVASVKERDALDSKPSSLRSRFIPGDPFAREEADVDTWARHFTYLSVVPATSFQRRLGDDEGAVQRAEARPNLEGGLGVCDLITKETNFPDVEAGDPVVIGREMRPDRRQSMPYPENPRTEEIIESHGILEEYIAYDYTPPAIQRWTEKSTDGSRHGQCSGLTTPQQELKEQIMDHLFDELWKKLVPDLSRAMICGREKDV